MSETTVWATSAGGSALRALIENVDLIDIRIVRWHGEVHDLNAQVIAQLEPELQSMFRIDENSIQCRWMLDTQVRDGAGKPVADLGLTLLQLFVFTERSGDYEVTPALLHEFVEKTAVISAFPFMREAVQTMTTRLGLPPVTLGLLRHGSSGPESFSVRSG